MVSAHRIWRAAVAVVLTFTGVAALPSLAAAQTLPAAPPTVFNETPDCPVSPAEPVCAWNVPVDANNLFTAIDYGQCPYWAVEKYPALFLGAVTGDPLASDWDGGTWAEHARLEGLTISPTPASGDLAVWSGTPSDSAGHVAYVEAVTGGGIIVSQMDGNSQPPFPPLQGSTEWISDANLAYFAQAYDLQFIVTGDPSTTPLAFLEKPTAPVTLAPVAETVTLTATPAAGADGTSVSSPYRATSAAAQAAAAARARARRAAAARARARRAAAARARAKRRRAAAARARQRRMAAARTGTRRVRAARAHDRRHR